MNVLRDPSGELADAVSRNLRIAPKVEYPSDAQCLQDCLIALGQSMQGVRPVGTAIPHSSARPSAQAAEIANVVSGR